jgi:hypothetical protein
MTFTKAQMAMKAMAETNWSQKKATVVLNSVMAEALGVHSCRKRRRADEVREHHSDLAALGGSLCVRCDRRRDRGCCRRGSGGRRGCHLVEVGDLTQQLASVTERHPNVLEVLIRQIRQDGKADVVFGKALRVLPETELL